MLDFTPVCMMMTDWLTAAGGTANLFAFTNLLKEKATVGVRRRLVYAAGFRLSRYTYKEVARPEDAKTLRPFTLFLIRREEHEN